jgi:pimeloyl-ACP methyl ester carboxylesterase
MRSSSGTFPFRDINGTVWLAYTDWGISTRENLLLCVHGHTRHGRDFTKLGEYFSKDWHTISFDLAGHGKVVGFQIRKTIPWRALCVISMA